MLRARTCTVQWTYILRTVHRRRLAIHGVHHTRESCKGQGGPEGTKGEREHRAYPPPPTTFCKVPDLCSLAVASVLIGESPGGWVNTPRKHVC